MEDVHNSSVAVPDWPSPLRQVAPRFQQYYLLDMAIDTLEKNNLTRHPPPDPVPARRFRASRPFLPHTLAVLFLLVGCTTQVAQRHFASRSLHYLPADIQVHASAQQVVFEVFSDPGIGKAAISTLSSSWPPEVIIRLHLDSLEGFTATIGDSTFHLQELEISHIKTRQENYFDIYLPTQPHISIEEIEFTWIDYYR